MDKKQNNDNLEDIKQLSSEDIQELFSDIVVFPDNVYLGNARKDCMKLVEQR